MFLTGQWNHIAYDVATACFVTLIFYFLVVWLPERLKRERMKKVFAARYASFKIDCIAIFLGLADGSYDADLPKQLLNQAQFRKYFHGERWYSVANGLQGFPLDELITRMEIFRDDTLFVLNNTDIGNDTSFEFFQRLSAAIYERKKVNPDYDGIKSLCRFLWEIFSGWNFIDGYPKRDVIEEMIKAI